MRPTGLVDPQVIVRPASTQVDDLLSEINLRVKKQERVLVTTLTKRMAEELTEYLAEHGVKVRYLHSEVETVERVEIIRDLRLGEFDVLVGINLLREGLDLPEVSLVAILDADKEGFLRSERSLIQTMGRAARHLNGTAILYADTMTDSIKRAIAETDRRRSKQTAYNEHHSITPKSIMKRIKDLIDGVYDASQMQAAQEEARYEAMSEKQIAREIKALEKKMLEHARNLEFEDAAAARDRLTELKKKVFGIEARGTLTFARARARGKVAFMLWKIRLLWYRADKALLAFSLFAGFVVGSLAFAASLVFIERDDRSARIRDFHARNIDCLARNVYYEARGEPAAGQYAVAEVTMNRKALAALSEDRMRSGVPEGSVLVDRAGCARAARG